MAIHHWLVNDDHSPPSWKRNEEMNITQEGEEQAKINEDLSIEWPEKTRKWTEEELAKMKLINDTVVKKWRDRDDE